LAGRNIAGERLHKEVNYVSARSCAHELNQRPKVGDVLAKFEDSILSPDDILTRDKKPRHHKERADNERRTSAPLVEEEDGRERENNVDHVLYCRSCEWRGNLRTLHDVDDVVHHDVHTTELAPHLPDHCVSLGLRPSRHRRNIPGCSCPVRLA
jgi:hypothetical protein